jgi:hypothetical protein
VRRGEGMLPLGPQRPPVPRSLLVMLLPGMLEALPQRELLEALLQAPDAVAVEPARVSYRAIARLPRRTAHHVARRQAKRMRLPGVPRVVAALDPLQVPLAAALMERHPAAELWYWADADADPTSSAAELHALARGRAAARFELPLSAPLWTRMESLGIESGRLGSERLPS